MDNITEILIVAQEILESELDWCQGQLYRHNDTNYDDIEITSACAIGALNLAIERQTGLAAFKNGDFWTIRLEAEDRLVAQLPSYELSVPSFNDRPSTSKEDVLLLFKKAINNLPEESY